VRSSEVREVKRCEQLLWNLGKNMQCKDAVTQELPWLIQKVYDPNNSKTKKPGNGGVALRWPRRATAMLQPRARDRTRVFSSKFILGFLNNWSHVCVHSLYFYVMRDNNGLLL
jgi:hypothetical protein